MRAILIKVVWGVFSVLVALFIFALTPFREQFGRFEVFPGIPLIVLGLVVVVLAATLNMNTLLKCFLVVAGASAIGWPSSLFLHNFLYYYYPTEPVTYILFFLVFPLSFAIGAIGSIAVGLISLLHRSANE
jgi:hypothetical protein